MTLRMVDAVESRELVEPVVDIRSSAQRISVLFELAARPAAVIVVFKVLTRWTRAVSITLRVPDWRNDARNGAAAISVTRRTSPVTRVAVLERNGQGNHQNRIDDLPPPWSSTNHPVGS